MTKKKPRRCTAKTLAGTRCKRSAQPGTDPPRCSIPSHQKPKPGPPWGNENAKTHGFYSAIPETNDFEVRIADLKCKRAQLSAMLEDEKDEDAEDELGPLDYAKALDLLGRLDSRIQRLEQKHREQQGRANEIQDGLQEALKLVWEILEVKSTKKNEGRKG